METITVETKMHAPGAPADIETFEKTGGLFALQVSCAQDLLARGCAEETIQLGPPSLVDGEWTMHGTGTKEAMK